MLAPLSLPPLSGDLSGYALAFERLVSTQNDTIALLVGHLDKAVEGLRASVLDDLGSRVLRLEGRLDQFVSGSWADGPLKADVVATDVVEHLRDPGTGEEISIERVDHERSILRQQQNEWNWHRLTGSLLRFRRRGLQLHALMQSLHVQMCGFEFGNVDAAAASRIS